MPCTVHGNTRSVLGHLHWLLCLQVVACQTVSQLQIERIQNRKLWQHYCGSKQQMQERWAHDPSLTLEQDLWHGSTCTDPALIYTDEYGMLYPLLV